MCSCMCDLIFVRPLNNWSNCGYVCLCSLVPWQWPRRGRHELLGRRVSYKSQGAIRPVLCPWQWSRKGWLACQPCHTHTRTMAPAQTGHLSISYPKTKLRSPSWNLGPRFSNIWGKIEQLKSCLMLGQKELPSPAASAPCLPPRHLSKQQGILSGPRSRGQHWWKFKERAGQTDIYELLLRHTNFNILGS